MMEKNKSTNKRKWILCLFGIFALIVLAAFVLRNSSKTDQEIPENKEAAEDHTSDPIEPADIQMDKLKDVSINLGSGMRITAVGKYTGVYMEDGSDEVISGVMMIAVENEGEDTIQYAEIRVPVGNEEAFFTMSTLTPGSRMILLEQNRMDYVPADYTTAIAENVVLFSEPLSLCEDRLKLQILDGMLNVTNISGADMEEDILIYYKNSAADVFYGGITYRVRLEGGLKKDEIRQIMADHLSKPGSTIMFVTCGAE